MEEKAIMQQLDLKKKKKKTKREKAEAASCIYHLRMVAFGEGFIPDDLKFAARQWQCN